MSSPEHNPLPGLSQYPSRSPPQPPEMKDTTRSPPLEFVHSSTVYSPPHVTNEEFPRAPLLNCTSLYGMPVLTQISGRKTTIGGIIVSSDRFYGLTVSHSIIQATKSGLGDIPESINGSSTADDDYGDFAFDSDEEETTIEGDVADAAITSKGTLSKRILAPAVG